MRERLKVYRVEKSRVIVIEFSSEDPAARRQGAAMPSPTPISVPTSRRQTADQHRRHRLAGAGNRGPVRKGPEAEAKVADYRSQTDILDGQNNSALATQQLSELSTEMTRVRAARANAEARAASLRAILERRRVD